MEETLIQQWRRRMITRGGLVVALTLVPFAMVALISAGGGGAALPEGIQSLTSGPSEQAAGLELTTDQHAQSPSNDIVALAPSLGRGGSGGGPNGSSAGGGATGPTGTTPTVGGGGGTVPPGGGTGTPPGGGGGGTGGGGGGILPGGGSGSPGIGGGGGGDSLLNTLDTISKAVGGLLPR